MYQQRRAQETDTIFDSKNLNYSFGADTAIWIYEYIDMEQRKLVRFHAINPYPANVENMVSC
jgi:hypothetical protein